VLLTTNPIARGTPFLVKHGQLGDFKGRQPLGWPDHFAERRKISSRHFLRQARSDSAAFLICGSPHRFLNTMYRGAPNKGRTMRRCFQALPYLFASKAVRNGYNRSVCKCAMERRYRRSIAMSSGGSVTAWIQQLKNGEEAALAKVHARYWRSLVAIARKRLAGAPRRASDEEDVAQEAFWSFYRSLKAGRVPRVVNRDDLLALLTHIIACRAANQIHHEVGVQKRDAGAVQDASVLEELSDAVDPTPLEQAVLNDCYRHYLTSLSENHRDFAELWLAGYTHKEIAGQLGFVERTVERKIARILAQWREIGLADMDANA
jgi:RNA polymerase sigma factor (sigma-70 family)